MTPLGVGDKEPFVGDFQEDHQQQQGQEVSQGWNMQATWEDFVGRQNTHNHEVQAWMGRTYIWMEGVDTTLADLTEQM